MRRCIRSLQIALALAALATSATAEPERGWLDGSRLYLGGGLGVSRVHPDAGGTVYTVKDSSSYGYKLTLGYDVTERLSAEAYYADLGEAKLRPRGTVEYRDFGLTGLYHFYQQGEPHRGWEAYAKGGLGRMKNDSDLNYERAHSTHVMLGLGGGFGFANGVMLRADVDLFDKDSQLFTLNLIKRLGVTKTPPPPDSDGDGVIDAADRCPGTPAGREVDATGCEPPPPDSDGDGVIDAADRCPRTPAGRKVDATGCEPPPPDSDGDGVIDAADRCPRTPAGREVDATGCEPPPPDSDGDGVIDAADRCPATPAETPVDRVGCPLPPPDGDGDGVPDALDRCPDTPAGVTVDGAGCTLRVLVLKGVTFEHDSAVLTGDSRAILDEVAAGLVERGDPRAIRVVGHTDSWGDAEYNQRLAQHRADSVRAYLIDRGVPAEQLVAESRGESEPIADNGTAAGRETNRRVELVWE